ncbi:unnamed protein product [Caenorhabditis bovis]|uniref:SXP/RAL-2 family protein Ani s 5-like cation-binding domain-containing protein n=1 Tax=Caenorhabditis bovis TaxID=2654633 RepID=A0A8S1EQG0_9PELO|nr:unnamed protein product [Caenorhabditis bovis]
MLLVVAFGVFVAGPVFAQTVSDEAAIAPQSNPTVTPNQWILPTLPTIDPNAWLKLIPSLPPLDPNAILANLPTLPPIPTLDPNFWANLPTLAPLPTLDPNFWNNLPTLPTLDPNFWANLPTLAPLPTLDPNFWNNLPTLPTLDPNFWANLPTLAPLPTLDPNFWSNLPTLPPFPTIDPNIFKIVPRAEQCAFKLHEEIAKNAADFNFTNIRALFDDLSRKMAIVCSVEQRRKFGEFLAKYPDLIENAQSVRELPTVTDEETRNVVDGVLKPDGFAVLQFFLKKSMENLQNPTATAILNKLSTQLSIIQLDLLFSPI